MNALSTAFLVLVAGVARCDASSECTNGLSHFVTSPDQVLNLNASWWHHKGPAIDGGASAVQSIFFPVASSQTEVDSLPLNVGGYIGLWDANCLDVPTAAAVWKSLQDVAGNAAIGPVFSLDPNCADPSTFEEQFEAELQSHQCSDSSCLPSGPFAYESRGCTMADVNNELEYFKSKLGVDKEFAVLNVGGRCSDLGTVEQQVLLRGASQLLQQSPNVARYSWSDGAQSNSTTLLFPDGDLTLLGRMFASFTCDLLLNGNDSCDLQWNRADCVASDQWCVWCGDSYGCQWKTTMKDLSQQALCHLEHLMYQSPRDSFEFHPDGDTSCSEPSSALPASSMEVVRFYNSNGTWPRILQSMHVLLEVFGDVDPRNGTVNPQLAFPMLSFTVNVFSVKKPYPTFVITEMNAGIPMPTPILSHRFDNYTGASYSGPGLLSVDLDLRGLKWQMSEPVYFGLKIVAGCPMTGFARAMVWDSWYDVPWSRTFVRDPTNVASTWTAFTDKYAFFDLSLTSIPLATSNHTTPPCKTGMGGLLWRANDLEQLQPGWWHTHSSFLNESLRGWNFAPVISEEADLDVVPVEAWAVLSLWAPNAENDAPSPADILLWTKSEQYANKLGLPLVGPVVAVANKTATQLQDWLSVFAVATSVKVSRVAWVSDACNMSQLVYEIATMKKVAADSGLAAYGAKLWPLEVGRGCAAFASGDLLSRWRLAGFLKQATQHLLSNPAIEKYSVWDGQLDGGPEHLWQLLDLDTGQRNEIGEVYWTARPLGMCGYMPPFSCGSRWNSLDCETDPRCGWCGDHGCQSRNGGRCMIPSTKLWTGVNASIWYPKQFEPSEQDTCEVSQTGSFEAIRFYSTWTHSQVMNFSLLLDVRGENMTEYVQSFFGGFAIDVVAYGADVYDPFLPKPLDLISSYRVAVPVDDLSSTFFSDRGLKVVHVPADVWEFRIEKPVFLGVRVVDNCPAVGIAALHDLTMPYGKQNKRIGPFFVRDPKSTDQQWTKTKADLALHAVFTSN